jgi:hypothetical protein
MKAIVILSLCCLFSFNSFSQKITYKDLKGKWVLQNVPQLDMSFNFVDAKNVIGVTIAKGLNYDYDHSSDTVLSIYVLDTSSNTTKLITTKVSNNPDANSDTVLIKIVKGDVLECQKNTIPPNKWNDSEFTLYYTKVKDTKN